MEGYGGWDSVPTNVPLGPHKVGIGMARGWVWGLGPSQSWLQPSRYEERGIAIMHRWGWPSGSPHRHR